MSGNPNPTVCGNCNTENPPGAEQCQECGEALTLSAEETLMDRDAAERQDPLLDSAPPVAADLGTIPLSEPDPAKDRPPTD